MKKPAPKKSTVEQDLQANLMAGKPAPQALALAMEAERRAEGKKRK